MKQERFTELATSEDDCRTPRGEQLLDLKGTGVIPKNRLTEIIDEVFDLRPAAIIEYLDLLRPIFRKTAAYGHFGWDDPEYTWEKIDKINDLQKDA